MDARIELDADDRRLLQLLEVDGRTSYSDLATATGRPLTTVRRRIAELRASGALYFDVDLDYRALDLRMQTRMATLPSTLRMETAPVIQTLKSL